MYTLIIYDISSDETREKVAKACKEAGLVRIQKSAFLGTIDAQRRKHLKRRIMRLIHGENANVQIFQICNYDMGFREILGVDTVEEDGDLMII